MPAELLETTCDFGLAPTGAGCDLTLASYDPDAYVETQVQYLAIGAILVLVTGFLCRSAKRNKCSNLQQRSLLLCFYAALTFAARGIDPGSYKHILPRPIINLLSSTCTAALYSIYILSLVYWATIIQQGAGLERSPKLQCLQYASISAVWMFYVLLSISSFLSKGFFTIEMTVIEMLGSAGFLLLVSVAFLVYGIRVMRRLRIFERHQRQQQHLDRLRRQAGIDSAGEGMDVTTSRITDTAFVEEGQYDPESSQSMATRRSHTVRIRKILLVVETFAFVVVVAQLYVGISNSRKPNKELDCANGFKCSHVHSSVNILHWCQAVCVCVITWVFRHTRRRERAASAIAQA